MKRKLYLNNILIYDICLLLYSVVAIFSSTYIDNIIPAYVSINNYSYILVSLLLLFLFFINYKFNKKSLLIIAFSMLLMFFILTQNFDKRLLVLILLLISLPKKITFKHIAGVLFFGNTVSLLIVILLSNVGLIYDYSFLRNNVIRHGLGFVSANSVSNLVTSTIIIFSYYKKDNWKILYSIISIVILAFINQLTDSRLAFLLGLLTILFVSTFKFLNYSKSIKKVIIKISKYLFAFLFVFFIIFSIYLSKHNDFEYYYVINDFFSGRLNEIISFYNLYGFHLFGSHIYTVGIRQAAEMGIKWVGIDTSYINYTIRYGLLLMTFISYGYYKLGNYFENNNLLYEAIVVCLICIMGITENIIFLPYYNISLFWIYHLFINTKYLEKVNYGQEHFI